MKPAAPVNLARGLLILPMKKAMRRFLRVAVTRCAEKMRHGRVVMWMFLSKVIGYQQFNVKYRSHLSALKKSNILFDFPGGVAVD